MYSLHFFYWKNVLLNDVIYSFGRGVLNKFDSNNNVNNTSAYKIYVKSCNHINK